MNKCDFISQVRRNFHFKPNIRGLCTGVMYLLVEDDFSDITVIYTKMYNTPVKVLFLIVFFFMKLFFGRCANQHLIGTFVAYSLTLSGFFFYVEYNFTRYLKRSRQYLVLRTNVSCYIFFSHLNVKACYKQTFVSSCKPFSQHHLSLYNFGTFFLQIFNFSNCVTQQEWVSEMYKYGA